MVFAGFIFPHLYWSTLVELWHRNMILCERINPIVFFYDAGVSLSYLRFYSAKILK